MRIWFHRPRKYFSDCCDATGKRVKSPGFDRVYMQGALHFAGDMVSVPSAWKPNADSCRSRWTRAHRHPVPTIGVAMEVKTLVTLSNSTIIENVRGLQRRIDLSLNGSQLLEEASTGFSSRA